MNPFLFFSFSLVYSSILEEWTVANVVNDFAELDEDRITFRSSSASNDGETTCTCRSENLKLQEENSSLKQQMKETNEEVIYTVQHNNSVEIQHYK